MSAVAILFPIIAAWPVFFAAAASVAAGAGYSMVRTGVGQEEALAADAEGICELALENSENLALLMKDEGAITLQRQNVTITFTRVPGEMRVKMCVQGEGQTASELETVGREVYAQILQQYAYHQVVSELKSQGFAVSQEKVDEDQTIKLTVRRWS